MPFGFRWFSAGLRRRRLRSRPFWPLFDQKNQLADNAENCDDYLEDIVVHGLFEQKTIWRLEVFHCLCEVDVKHFRRPPGTQPTSARVRTAAARRTLQQQPIATWRMFFMFVEGDQKRRS